MVTVFQSAGYTAAMEALDVKGLLESNGVPVVLVRDTRYPSFPEEVRVPREQVERAEQLISEALAAGPAAAAEAEAEGEKQ